MLWPILSGLYFFCSIFDVGAPSWKLVVVFWKLFGLTFGDMVFMLLWTGLLVTVWRQSRWAMAFSAVLASLSLFLLLASWLSFGGIVGPDGFTAFTLLSLMYIAGPLFVLEATVKFWRRGQLR